MKDHASFIVVTYQSPHLNRVVQDILADYGFHWLDGTKHNFLTAGGLYMETGYMTLSYANPTDYYKNYSRDYNGWRVFDAKTQLGELMEWLDKVKAAPGPVIVKDVAGYNAEVFPESHVQAGCQRIEAAKVKEIYSVLFPAVKKA